MWVAADVARDLRRRIGTFYFYEWRACAEALGLQWVVTEVPFPHRAFVTHGIIFIDRRMGKFLQAWYAWHEMAHQVMDAGDALWWLTRPQGAVTVAKSERRANEFVLLFPVWPD